MTLSKRERTLLEWCLSHPGSQFRDTGWPKGAGNATVRELLDKTLIVGPRVLFKGFTYDPTALGRFVGTPLEWRADGEELRTDFLGGYAWVSPTTKDVGRYVWRAVLRGQCLYTAADTQDAARAACEAWVNAERLRQAGRSRYADHSV